MESDRVRAERNANAKAVGMAKGKGEDASALLQRAEELTGQLTASDAAIAAVQAELDAWLLGIPNLLHESVPEGRDETANKEVRRWGEPRKFDFKPKDHVELGEKLGGLDFEAAAKISGARFSVHEGRRRAPASRAGAVHARPAHARARLYRGLRAVSGARSGAARHRPAAEVRGRTCSVVQSEQGFFLIPTAEVPVTNLVRDSIVEPAKLPLKFVAHTPCFRSEAGAAGKDTRGLIRQHQFEKVELVHIVRPADSYAALEELTGERGEGAAEARTAHIAWWRCAPVTSASAAPRPTISKCGCRGRTATAKFPPAAIAKPSRRGACRRAGATRTPASPSRVHTLNGSGVAVGRALVAVLENYQNADGSITVPRGLRPYLDGTERLSTS